jgi:transcriptional regulator CtsR
LIILLFDKVTGLKNYLKDLELQNQKKLIVVTASDLNPKYLRCVPFFIDFWKLFECSNGYKIESKVAIIAEKIPEELQKYESHLILINNTYNLNSAFVAQGIRILIPQLLEADLVMTSDVDMFPLSLRILENSIVKLEELGDFVIYRDILSEKEIPICYNIASPQNWKILMSDLKSFQGCINSLEEQLTSRGGPQSYAGHHGGTGWTMDQEYLYAKVRENTLLNFIRLGADDISFHRLDRAYHKRGLEWIFGIMTLFRYWDDYHAHLPVEKKKYFLHYLSTLVKLQKLLNFRFQKFKLTRLPLVK